MCMLFWTFAVHIGHKTPFPMSRIIFFLLLLLFLFLLFINEPYYKKNVFMVCMNSKGNDQSMHSSSWAMLSLPIYSVTLELTHSVSGKRMPWSWWECPDLRTLFWVIGFHICPENLSFDGAHGIHMYASAFFVTHHMHYWKDFFCACERQNPWPCSLHGCIRTYPY